MVNSLISLIPLYTLFYFEGIRKMSIFDDQIMGVFSSVISPRFEKVSRVKDLEFNLPERSTKHSAGYDFYAYEDITIPSFIWELRKNMQLEAIDSYSRGVIQPYCIKTGVKAYMDSNMCLQLYARSSWPLKLGLTLANNVGIIDCDYYNNEDNEGEIGFLVYNLTLHDVLIRKGEKLGQGIFTKFYVTNNDESQDIRKGGFGSTGV